MDVDLDKVVKELGATHGFEHNLLRHVVVGKRKHIIDMDEEGALAITYVVKEKLLDFHREFLKQEPIVFDKIIEPEKINKSIKKGFVMSYMVEYPRYPRFNIDFISGKGQTLFTFVSYEIDVKRDREYLYMVTPGLKYGMQKGFMKGWKDSNTQKASLVGYDVENVIDNLLIEKPNKFDAFIVNGHSLRAFEVEDDLNDRVKKIEVFEIMLRNGINKIVSTYIPEYKGTYIVGNKKTKQEAWINMAEYKTFLYKIECSKNYFTDGLSEKEIDIKLRLMIFPRIFQKLITEYGASHDYTNQFRDHILDWARSHQQIQEKLNFNVEEKLLKVL